MTRHPLYSISIQSVCHAILFVLFFTNAATFAQVGTEIYLVDFRTENDEMMLSNPINITNRTGYDNQPFFHPDKPVLYYVSADAAGNTDIMEFNYKLNKTRKFKNTPEREYSPQVTPDKKFISCIIQRENGQQDLGKYPIEGGSPVILIDRLTVGYHTWIDNHTVVVFSLPDPFTLHVINLDTSADSIIAHNIGRSLHKIPGERTVSFIQKTETNDWLIKKFDAINRSTSVIIKSLPGNEHDMTWTADGKIIMSDGKRIFYAGHSKAPDWKEVKFQPEIALNTITRLAVNSQGDKMAIVVNE